MLYSTCIQHYSYKTHSIHYLIYKCFILISTDLSFECCVYLYIYSKINGFNVINDNLFCIATLKSREAKTYFGLLWLYQGWIFIMFFFSHGWVVTFQDSHPTVFTFRSRLDLLDVVLAFWISILKISKLLQNCLHRVIDITSFEKHLESSLDRTPNFCQNLVIFRSKNMYLKESLIRSSTVI